MFHLPDKTIEIIKGSRKGQQQKPFSGRKDNGKAKEGKEA
jgi:hypothetical protein